MDLDLEALRRQGCIEKEEVHFEQIIETMCYRVEQMVSTFLEHHCKRH